MFLRIKILFVICLLVSKSILGQSYDFIKILPGQGIVYNNDSILLYRTSIEELHKILKIKETNPYNVSFVISCGDECSESYERTIKKNTINFEFGDEWDEYNLQLWKISITDDKALKIYTDNGLSMGMINPDIKKLFPVFEERDRISQNGLS